MNHKQINYSRDYNMQHTLIYRLYGKARKDNVAMIDAHLNVIQQSHQSILDFFSELESSKNKTVQQYIEHWWKQPEHFYNDMTPQQLISHYRNQMIYGDNKKGKAIYKLKELLASVDVNNDAIEAINSLIESKATKELQPINRRVKITLMEDTSYDESDSRQDPKEYCKCTVCTLKYTRARVKNSTNYGDDTQVSMVTDSKDSQGTVGTVDNLFTFG